MRSSARKGAAPDSLKNNNKWVPDALLCVQGNQYRPEAAAGPTRPLVKHALARLPHLARVFQRLGDSQGVFDTD
jgi:hypothetical protein